MLNFITLYISPKLVAPFQLTLLTSKKKDQSSTEFSEPLFNYATERLSEISNLHFDIIVFNDKRCRDKIKDRRIITNYTKGSFGHPFTENSTHFSQIFIAHRKENIDHSYKEYNQLLKDFYIMIEENAIDKLGQVKMRYRNELFTNRLFLDLGKD